MRLAPLLRMRVDLGERIPIGRVPKGRCNVWVLKGGGGRGAGDQGHRHPVGGDFELVDAGGACHIDVRLVIRTDDGANIFVQYFGVAHTPPEIVERYRRGDPVNFGETHFVTQPRFETEAPRYAWLNHVMAVAEGRGTGIGVEYLMYACIPDDAIGLAGVPAHFTRRG